MTSTGEPYVGVCVGVAVRVGQHQQVDVHGVQQGGQRRVSTVVSGDLNEKHTSDEIMVLLKQGPKKMDVELKITML